MRTRRSVAFGLCLALGIVLVMSKRIQAQQVVLQGSGSGAFDVPAAGNGAVAFAQCTLDRGAQTITCTSRVYNIVDLIAGHIHVGGPGVSGPVVIPIPNLPLHISGSFGQSWTWSSTDFAPTAGSAGAGLASLDDLMNSCAAGGCYLNWHTAASPGGAVRVN